MQGRQLHGEIEWEMLEAAMHRAGEIIAWGDRVKDAGGRHAPCMQGRYLRGEIEEQMIIKIYAR